MKKAIRIMSRGMFVDWAVRQKAILAELMARNPFGERGAKASRKPKKKRFTLIELLVVGAAVAVVCALLLPAVTRSREISQQIQCRDNVHRILLGFVLFADDHDDYLPGGYRDAGKCGEEAWKGDWLFGGDNPNWCFTDGPECGTVFPYVGDVRDYRCPSLGVTGVGTGEGSNGQFDYASFEGFAGAQLKRIPPIAEPIAGAGEALATPIVMEEDPKNGINSVSMEGSHSGTDRFARTHRGRANYGAFDGSVQLYEQPLNGEAREWQAMWADGTPASPGTSGVPWGWWNGCRGAGR